MKFIYVVPFVFGLKLIRAEIDVFDIEGHLLAEARLYSGNATDHPSFLLERSAFDIDSLQERQTCQTGWGTCPGGTACGCPRTALCCGNICQAVQDTCCAGFICPSGWGCCGTAHCYPYGGDCCSNERYCDPGEICVRLNGDAASIRCSVIGATYSATVTTYGSISTPTYTPPATTRTTITTYSAATTYTSQVIQWYTRTYTFFYFLYRIETTSYDYATYTSYSSKVDWDYTSTITILSAQASRSADALAVMSSSASILQDSVSSSAESVGDSMSAYVRTATVTTTSRTSTATSGTSTATSTRRASTTPNGPSTTTLDAAGGASSNLTSGSVSTVSNLWVVLGSLSVGLIAGLMVLL